jgi:hypothetical protein
MALRKDYVTKEPTRAEIDALNAPTVLEFGTAPHRCSVRRLSSGIPHQSRRWPRPAVGTIIRRQALANVGVSQVWQGGRTAGKAAGRG